MCGRPLYFPACDGAGQEGFDKIRVISYRGTNLFVLCFAINNRASFENVRTKWLRELSSHPDSRAVPILLVGTKCDVRETEAASDDDDAQSSKLEVQYYLVCSGTGSGVPLCCYCEVLSTSHKCSWLNKTCVFDISRL